jgi:translation initiation factor 5B
MYKRHMLQAQAMKRKEPKYAVVLAFDVVITEEADQLAKEVGITVFRANIIYHLFDHFTKYCESYDQRMRDEARPKAVFPVQLKITAAIRNTDPMILAVRVVRGQLHPGTPLCFLVNGRPSYIGKVESIQKDQKDAKKALAGTDVSCKINTSETNICFGRQITADTELLSLVTRESVDAIKLFKSEMQQDDTNFLSSLMNLLHVPRNTKPGPKAETAAA